MATETLDTTDPLNDGPVRPTSDAVVVDAPSGTRSDKLAPGHFRAIALLMASAFTVILNETTMSVALPPIMDELGITPTVGQWLTTAFLLTMAVVIPATGYLINRLGTRGAYLLAMSLFTVGTALHRSDSLAIVQVLVLYHLVTGHATVSLGGEGPRVVQAAAR